MRICYISDANIKGSGYFSIAHNLCTGLTNLGHDVKMLGLNYRREEHNYPFSIIPCKGFKDVALAFHNLVYLWNPQVVIVAFDIPVHRKLIIELQKHGVPYIGITPIESDPLCLPWAMPMMGMADIFIISEAGRKEAVKAGIIQAKHLPIGVDYESWRVPEAEKKKIIRSSMLGIEDDTFVILTVADNQERKNLSASMEILAEFKWKTDKNFRYLLVTREYSEVGWEIKDYARILGISDNIMVFERGLPFKYLWSLYAASDCFLLTPKGEGHGFPVVEAMSVGLIVMVTACGALVDHAEGGCGFLIPPKFVHTDPWGNSHRYYVDVERGAEMLKAIYQMPKEEEQRISRCSRLYAETKKWDTAINMLHESILRVGKQDV